ncbi:uncharacterized protein LOC107460531 [Arachis duranensis]|uniref:Uncharacterized protein LOC107460531 n=1 Tax=Arachis duranensis TaxID=130453 RepID=A0A9C6WL90_ARADU|nr:uncharacterized protein LOC107460531 [Arachis duranensis]
MGAMDQQTKIGDLYRPKISDCNGTLEHHLPPNGEEGDQSVAVKSVFERQRRLYGFIPRANSHSLWIDQFPISDLADRVSQYPGDMGLTRRTGVEGMGNLFRLLLLDYCVLVVLLRC